MIMKACNGLALDPERVKTLKFIDGYVKEHGVGPSQKEMMKEFGLKTNTAVGYRMNTLEKYKLINRKPEGYEGKQPPRYIQIVEENRHYWDDDDGSNS